MTIKDDLLTINEYSRPGRKLVSTQVVASKPVTKTTWDKIKDSFISWCVPFIMGALLYYTASGGFKK
jgi:hypothetical protein